MEPTELEAEGPVKEVEIVDSGRLPVPGAEPDGPTPLLVELDTPQLVGAVPPGGEGEDEGLPGPVDAASLVGDALDEGTVTVVTSLVVRSVICVVDSLVAIVATKLLVKVVGGRVVSPPLPDSEVDTGAETVTELIVRVSTTVLVTSVSSYVDELVANVVTRVRVVVVGSVMLRGPVPELALGPVDDGTGDPGSLGE